MDSKLKVMSKNGHVLCEHCGKMPSVGVKDYIERELDDNVLALKNGEEGTPSLSDSEEERGKSRKRRKRKAREESR